LPQLPERLAFSTTAFQVWPPVVNRIVHAYAGVSFTCHTCKVRIRVTDARDLERVVALRANGETVRLVASRDVTLFEVASRLPLLFRVRFRCGRRRCRAGREDGSYQDRRRRSGTPRTRPVTMPFACSTTGPIGAISAPRTAPPLDHWVWERTPWRATQRAAGTTLGKSQPPTRDQRRRMTYKRHVIISASWKLTTG